MATETDETETDTQPQLTDEEIAALGAAATMEPAPDICDACGVICEPLQCACGECLCDDCMEDHWAMGHMPGAPDARKG